jgi:MoxR-like ATPase
MSYPPRELNERVRQESDIIRKITRQINTVLVGQERLVNRMLLALLCGGHLLVEGVPGLAKTLAVKALASTLHADFKRIQFTPDLLPSDLIGTQIYQPATGAFSTRQGPIFANIVLADEINRAPAKVQSALLEAMEERQVTLGDTTHRLRDPFMVLATQNPIEQEGTYPLPEAQLDRFMLKVVISYPTRDEEAQIVARMSGGSVPFPEATISPDALHKARQLVDEIYVDQRIIDYVLNIIAATRKPAEEGFKKLQALIAFGASPRGTLALVRASKALAFVQGRGYVVPDDVKNVASDVLRHRLILSFEALAEGVTTQHIIQQLLKQIEVP